jgi:hypothetical protein
MTRRRTVLIGAVAAATITLAAAPVAAATRRPECVADLEVF